MGFNPCCNGMVVKDVALTLCFSLMSFNPCCNGMVVKESDSQCLGF